MFLKIGALWVGCALLVTAFIPMVSWGTYFGNLHALDTISIVSFLHKDTAEKLPTFIELINYHLLYITQITFGLLLVKFGLK